MAEQPHDKAICAAIQRCLHARRDVRKAKVHQLGEAAGQRKEAVIVEILKADGTSKEIDTTIPKLLDGRTVGEILTHWLGPEPRTKAGDRLPDRAEDERRRLFACTAGQAASHNRRAVVRAAATQPNHSETLNSSESEGQASDGTAPQNPTPDATGKLTRQQMIDAGFTREERAQQYRKQRGPHPDDDTPDPMRDGHQRRSE